MEPLWTGVAGATAMLVGPATALTAEESNGPSEVTAAACVLAAVACSSETVSPVGALLSDLRGVLLDESFARLDFCFDITTDGEGNCQVHHD